MMTDRIPPAIHGSLHLDADKPMRYWDKARLTVTGMGAPKPLVQVFSDQVPFKDIVMTIREYRALGYTVEVEWNEDYRVTEFKEVV